MAKIHRFKQSIYFVLKYNCDGSFETQNNRRNVLFLVADELHKAGYKLTHIRGLKQKHIKCLNKKWQEHGLTVATIKNRYAMLRWAMNKINKRNVMPSNEGLGLGKRVYITNVNKAVELKDINLNKITNKYVKVQIHLQRYLGLRREEAIKFKPHKADCGKYIKLESSWCKGGRERTVPILSKEARYWIEEAKKLAIYKNDSLIPRNSIYIQARRTYDKQLKRANVKHPHGLRHAYAQERYKALTGWECPAKGGLTLKQLTREQREIDRNARLIISEALGHSREQITGAYLGR